MIWELRRIEPLRAANVSAVVYGIMTAIFMVIFLPILLLGVLFSGEPRQAFMLILFLFYPVLGVIMGWLSGLIGAAIYNFIIRWTGGLLFGVQTREASPPAVSTS